MLVDALVTKGESQELAGWLATTGKDLTEVYITHAHGDHFFGLNTVLDKLPKARAVALPELMPLLGEQATPEWMQIWNSFSLTSCSRSRRCRSRSTSPSSRLRGHTLHVLKLGQSDVADSTAVHVPGLDTLLPGDVIYSGIHLWMYQSDHAQRMDWIETVNEVEKLGVKTIIAGHTDPAAPDNDAARLIEATQQYVYDFDQAVASSSGGEEVVSKMTAKYPELGNPYTLWLAVYTRSYGDYMEKTTGTAPTNFAEFARRTAAAWAVDEAR